MIELKRIMESDKKLKFLDTKDKTFIRGISNIMNKRGDFIAPYNSYVAKNIGGLKHVMYDSTWQTKYDKAYSPPNQKQKEFLQNFERYQPNPSCVPIRIYFDW